MPNGIQEALEFCRRHFKVAVTIITDSDMEFSATVY
jgi:hypothetical protein